MTLRARLAVAFFAIRGFKFLVRKTCKIPGCWYVAHIAQLVVVTHERVIHMTGITFGHTGMIEIDHHPIADKMAVRTWSFVMDDWHIH